ncbi:hypothetical protein LCGC14_2475240, partial [marine sediment metagenome]
MKAEVVVAAAIAKENKILLAKRTTGRNPESIGLYEM